MGKSYSGIRALADFIRDVAKYQQGACSNPQFMRDANAKVGKPNMPRVSMQKNAKIMQKSNLKTEEIQTCNGWK